MTQIKYNKLEDFFRSLNNKRYPQLFLLSGQEYLIDEKNKFIVSNLLSKKDKELSYTVLSGENLTIANIIDGISTFSVFMEKKVIYAKDLQGSREELQRLSDFLKKGIPDNNFLIITFSKTDKRSNIYKTMDKFGICIDCSISKGLSRQNIEEQKQFLRCEMESVLKDYQKEIDEKAFLDLIDLTGFEIETFIDNLKKLSLYIGQKQKISADDVSRLIQRTKINPIFDFTNAYSDKNIEKSLFLLNSLLNSNFHVLQILKALANHIRKIYAAKCFIESFDLNRKLWVKGLNYNSFNNNIVPEIKKADSDLSKEIESWQGHSSDFFLASKSKSTYPEYQIFKKSDNFSLKELQSIIIEISELDSKFKSSSQDPHILINDFIFRTCI